MPKKNKKEVTRFGPVHKPEIRFGNEERFAWQNAKFASDVMYDVPVMNTTKSVVFGTASRGGMDDANPEQKKSSTGPGSYDYGHCYDHVSEYMTKQAARFAAAPRQSMAMKTPSPGAVYNIDNQFYRGPEKKMGISFGNDTRKPLYAGNSSADAEMLWPKLPTGPSVTIGKRIIHKDSNAESPGPVYDVLKYANFKTGPAFSFGRGRGERFNSSVGFLPELD